jgi:predicted dehydrogenase
VNVLVVGCGSMGRRHAENARALGHDVFTCDSDKSRGTVFHSVESALRHGKHWHAIVVAVPAARHADVVLQVSDWCAVYRRRLPHMLIEKPLTTTRSSAQALALLTGLQAVTQVGYNWRYHPDVVAFQRAIDGLGYDYLHLTCDTDMASWPGAGYADPLLECSHEIDLLRALRGADLRLVAASRHGDGADGARLEFEHGDVVDVRWNVPQSRTFLAVGPIGPVTSCHPSLDAGVEESYRLEMEDFLEWTDTPFASGGASCTLADAAKVVEICEKAKELL